METEEKEQEKEGREELARIWERRRGNLLQFEEGKLRKLKKRKLIERYKIRGTIFISF